MILRPGFYNCDAARGVTSSGLSCRHIAAARRGGGGSRRFVFFPRANFGSEQSCRDAAGAITIMNAKAHSKFPPALARAIAVSGWNRVPPSSQSTTTCIETMENSLRSLPQFQHIFLYYGIETMENSLRSLPQFQRLLRGKGRGDSLS